MRRTIAFRVAVVVVWLNLPALLQAQVNDLSLKLPARATAKR
jgi:hypothetical protein